MLRTRGWTGSLPHGEESCRRPGGPRSSGRVTRGLIDRQERDGYFLKIFIVVVLALAFIGWLAARGCHEVRRHARTFASTRRYQVRKPERKCPRLFPCRDIDHSVGRAHPDPSRLQLSGRR